MVKLANGIPTHYTYIIQLIRIKRQAIVYTVSDFNYAPGSTNNLENTRWSAINYVHIKIISSY